MPMPKLTVDALINTLVHLRGAYMLHKNNVGNLAVHDPQYGDVFDSYRGFIDLQTGEFVPHDTQAEVKAELDDDARRTAEEGYPR